MVEQQQQLSVEAEINPYMWQDGAVCRYFEITEVEKKKSKKTLKIMVQNQMNMTNKKH